MQLTMFSSLFCAHFVAAAAALSLPPPTGLYNVGTKAYVLAHTTLNDPVAPSNISKSVLVNIYYPTRDPVRSSRYLWSGLTDVYDAYYGLSNGTFNNISASLAKDAKPLSKKEHDKSHLPTLLFGPALAGPPTQLFTGLISEMASRGFPVVTVDHPWEAAYIEYPDGTSFAGHDFTWAPCPDVLNAVHEYRLADNSAILDALPRISKELGIPLDTKRFAFFGHSLGGSAAVSQILVERNREASRDKKFLGTIDIDGTINGEAAANSSVVDNRAPALLLGSEFHDPRTGLDPTWPLFNSYQTSWTKSLRILGHSNHTDYSDLIFLKQANGIAGGQGAIPAERFLQVSRTVVADFFGMLVGRREGVLSGSEKVREKFPEVAFDYNGAGNPCTPANICWPYIPDGPEPGSPSC